MTIPESQLEIWSRRGADAGSRDTHTALRSALDSHLTLPSGVRRETYLQGSYRNSTNIRGDSDVDLVVEMTNPIFLDESNLTTTGSNYLRSHYGSLDYDWQQFRSAIANALRTRYGFLSVVEGSKSLKVVTPYLPADVVVCQTFRRFPDDNAANRNIYVEGMRIWVPNEFRWIQNYPKAHAAQGETKNKQANGNFKPTVRMFKNARNRAISNGRLGNDAAPSYFIECLLFNAPDSVFSGSRQETYFKAIDWASNADFSKLTFQHLFGSLVGTGIDQWSSTSAGAFVNAMATLWNDWQ